MAKRFSRIVIVFFSVHVGDLIFRIIYGSLYHIEYIIIVQPWNRETVKHHKIKDVCVFFISLGFQATAFLWNTDMNIDLSIFEVNSALWHFSLFFILPFRRYPEFYALEQKLSEFHGNFSFLFCHVNDTAPALQAIDHGQCGSKPCC